jgi:hypothetical protein
MTETVRVIDTNTVPWGDWHPQFPGTKSKELHFDAESGANLRQAYLPPGFTIAEKERHHHGDTREGVFILFGNIPYHEYDLPTTTEGQPFDFREGFLLDRTPRSIHGISLDPTSTLGCMILEWGTGPLEFNYIPFEGDLESFGTDFYPPHTADSASLPWEAHPDLKGCKIKMLSDGGATPDPRFHPVCLVHIPPGWSPTNTVHRGTTKAQRRWLYVLHGDAPVWTYDGTDAAKGTRHDLAQGHYLEWSSPATLGFESGETSEIGCVLLCVGTTLGD